MSINPTGTPWPSTTGSSLIFRSAMMATASLIIAPNGTLHGLAVITLRIGSSSSRSPRRSKSRAKSLSVKMPDSLPLVVQSMIAPVRRPGRLAETITSRTVCRSEAMRH